MHVYSTIFFYLPRDKLVSLGICVKETKTIKEGGYYHVYSAIDIKSFKIQTENKVKEIEASFHRILRKFEDSMEETIETAYNKEEYQLKIHA